jgi:hypothetical protein
MIFSGFWSQLSGFRFQFSPPVAISSDDLDSRYFFSPPAAPQIPLNINN